MQVLIYITNLLFLDTKSVLSLANLLPAAVVSVLAGKCCALGAPARPP